MHCGTYQISYFIFCQGSIGSCFTCSQRGSSLSSSLTVFDDSYKSSSILPSFLNLRMGKVPVSLYLWRMSLAVVNFMFNFLMALPIEYPQLLTILTNTFRFCVRTDLPSGIFWNIVFWRVFRTAWRPCYQLEILYSKYIFIDILGIITGNEFIKLAFFDRKRPKLPRIIFLYCRAQFFLFVLLLELFRKRADTRRIYDETKKYGCLHSISLGVVDYPAQFQPAYLQLYQTWPLSVFYGHQASFAQNTLLDYENVAFCYFGYPFSFPLRQQQNRG